MKILLVTFSDNADHQDTTFGLYEELLEKEDVYLLAIRSPKVSVVRSEKTWFEDCPQRPGVCKGTFNFSLLWNLIQRIRKENFDAIFFESLHVWNLPIMIFCGAKTHIYQFVHEVIPHEGDRQVKMVDLMNRAVCLLADTIVLGNRLYIDEMIARYKISKERVRFLELWRRYPSYTEPRNTGRMLFFGRINPYKGADNLLQIARMCPDIQFDVIGRVDPQMKDIASQLAQEQNVTFNDKYVSDDEMKEAFIQADCVLVPYNSASQSGIIIDAYKYSRPVVAFDVGAISEQVEQGVSGYLVQPGDNAAFAQALKEFKKMPKEKYTRLTKNAFEYGRQKYSATGAVQRFCALVNDSK